MDAMQNDSANAGEPVEENGQAAVAVLAGEDTQADEAQAGGSGAGQAGGQEAEDAHGPAQSAEAESGGAKKGADTAAAANAEAAELPQPRAADGESTGGKGKKRKAAPKSKAAAATKSLVVFREGKVHYADESVVVLDLDEAAHPDTDVHDVVDKLSELRDAVESPGRTEAVALVAELIQTKALA
jgi:hypothetical protein